MIGIYKITNKINNKVYVGQSINIAKRWEEHIYYSQEEDTALKKAFKKYGISNFSFEVLEECSKEELNEKETYWIKYYNSYENGYNMTSGGNAFTSQKVDSDKILEMYNSCGSIHQVCNKLNTSRTTVRNILQANNIYYDSHVADLIPVIMIDPFTLEELKIFPSIVDAGQAVNISDSAIRKALKQERPYSAGFYWKKVGDERVLKPLDKKPTERKAKIIEQYDLEGNKINEFKSASEANLALGKSRSNVLIGQNCRGERPSAYGYIWKYKE